MFKLYGMSISGNCHKVRLLLEQLQRPYQWQEVNILQGETQTEAFLAMNPAGQVPTLEISPGQYLVESNAMLCYLAEGTEFFTGDPYQKAQVLSWLFWEQYSHEPYIAVARFIKKFLPPEHARQAELPRLYERGNKALALMEQHLTAHDYFGADRYSIADIALYAYTHCASDGGFDLESYSAIQAWLHRVEAEPHFVKMIA